ncbi:hypothetical protein [Gymnodinialimonas sp.]
MSAPAKTSPKLKTDPSIADEFVTFIQHKLPGLEDGTFELHVSQKLMKEADPGKPKQGAAARNDDKDTDTRIDDGEIENTYTFAVQGDRFALSNGPGTLNSVFPANNASGEYSGVFAHAVLSNPAFPWTRSPQSTGPVAEMDVPVDQDRATWLAVLVFDEDDAQAHDGLTLTTQTGTLRDLFPPAALGPGDGKSTLGDNYSYFFGVTNTDGLEIGESLDDAIHYVDVPLSLFVPVAPTLDDLKLTAHVREVSVENKPIPSGTAAPDNPIGSFSIVIGTRLPQSMQQSHAVLVSLEGLSDFLPGDEDGTAPAGSNVNMTKSIRLAVLASWSFFATGTTAGFVDRLMALNGRGDGTGDAPNTNLRLDLPDAEGPVKDALALGYVPMNHDLRGGGNTVSWYRGPLSPAKVPASELQTPVPSADNLTVFDPTMGMLDVSLGAAWTIGRLAALQDTTFSTSLYQWKRGLSAKVVNEVERGLIDDLFGAIGAGQLGTMSADGKPTSLLGRAMGFVQEAESARGPGDAGQEDTGQEDTGQDDAGRGDTP